MEWWTSIRALAAADAGTQKARRQPTHFTYNSSRGRIFQFVSFDGLNSMMTIKITVLGLFHIIYIRPCSSQQPLSAVKILSPCGDVLWGFGVFGVYYPWIGSRSTKLAITSPI
jgi:hypothetical protein